MFVLYHFTRRTSPSAADAQQNDLSDSKDEKLEPPPAEPSPMPAAAAAMECGELETKPASLVPVAAAEKSDEEEKPSLAPEAVIDSAASKEAQPVKPAVLLNQADKETIAQWKERFPKGTRLCDLSPASSSKAQAVRILNKRDNSKLWHQTYEKKGLLKA